VWWSHGPRGYVDCTDNTLELPWRHTSAWAEPNDSGTLSAP
jgi:hypothetical protein